MAAPSNTTAATATVIATLPYSVAQPVSDGPTAYSVWYSYVAVDSEVEIGVFGWGASDLSAYIPNTYIYHELTGPTDLEEWPQPQPIVTVPRKPVQVPVVAGERYYFFFDKNANDTNAVLTLNVQTAPIEAAPVGSILVNDDTAGYPLAILSSVDGDDYHVLQYVYPFPAGEAGDALSGSGVFLFDDKVTDTFAFYYATLSGRIDLTFAGSGGGLQTRRIRACQGAQVFYIARAGGGGNPATVQTVSATGVLGTTTWTLPAGGLTGLAANNTQSVLYLAGQSGSINAPVKRWDLVNSVMLSDLVTTGIANYATGEMLYLADDTLLVKYSRTGYSTIVKRYDLTGATLNTYTFTETQSIAARIAYAIDDPNSFWVWTKDSGESIFRNVKCSDGTILAEIRQVEYEIGTYQPLLPTPTPLARFGNSSSCPLVVARLAIPAGGGGGNGGGGNGGGGNGSETGPGGLEFDPQPIRWLRQTPVLSDENRRMLHRSLTLDLEVGVGLTSGLGEDPLVMLQMSNDSGQTWHNLHPSSIGKLGTYTWRVIWRRLGQSRNRLYRFYGSDPVKICLLDAYSTIEQGDGS